MTAKKTVEGELMNKDGLQGGKLVSPQDYAKVKLAKRKAAQAAIAKKAK